MPLEPSRIQVPAKPRCAVPATGCQVRIAMRYQTLVCHPDQSPGARQIVPSAIVGMENVLGLVQTGVMVSEMLIGLLNGQKLQLIVCRLVTGLGELAEGRARPL